MSFHKKALIAFVIFHIGFTLADVLADKLQAHPAPTNDQDMIVRGVGLYVWVLFTLLTSLIGLGVAYFPGSSQNCLGGCVSLNRLELH